MKDDPERLPDAEYLSVAEFSELLRVPVSTVYAAVQQKRLAHRRIGGSIRIHRDAGVVPAEDTAPVRRKRGGLIVVRGQRRAV